MYSFPIPKGATVSSMTVWIDGQPIVGEVLKAEQARQLYEQEKQAGREAGLTEQKSYKRFEVSVSPVRARASTRIALEYLQVADVDTGIGRYVYPLEEGGTDDQKLAFWTANEQVTDRFSFRLNLRSFHGIEAVRLPSVSDAVVTQESAGEWSVSVVRDNSAGAAAFDASGLHQTGIAFDPASGLASENSVAGATVGSVGQVAAQLNQDLVVYWRMAQGLPGSLDFVPYKSSDNGRGTFMMVVTPGVDLQPITTGRDWVFVLDVSGSMQGKYGTLVSGVTKALGQLSVQDRFRLVAFNRQAWEITPGWVAADPQVVNYYADALSRITPDEGTNLYKGLKQALEQLDADRASGIVLVTDGVANVGETARKSFLRLLDKYDVRLFTMIMGNEANRPLLQSLADYSNGFALNVSNQDDIVGLLLSATQKISHEAMQDVEITFSGARVTDVVPERIGTVYRGEQIVLFGKYDGSGDVHVDLDARIGGQPVNYRAIFELPDSDIENPEIERLWAFRAIREYSLSRT